MMSLKFGLVFIPHFTLGVLIARYSSTPSRSRTPAALKRLPGRVVLAIASVALLSF